ncbi:MAG: hypothetical protein NT040_13225 [Bacteroidetes bacterium]|nr:hypothetical protein [Bacteroidota bacterium]
MKTATYTLIVLLTITTSLLFAGIVKPNSCKPGSAGMKAGIDLVTPLTVSPNLTGFSDGLESKNTNEILVSKLAPTTPKEAEFENGGLPVQIDINRLSPNVLKEAEFEETVDSGSLTRGILAPVPPAEADFME